MSRLENLRGRRVLVTGHTGFKGAWLSLWLHLLGAEVIGFSKYGHPNDTVYRGIFDCIDEEAYGDVADFSILQAAVNRFKPELIFHLAAQSLVQTGYQQPFLTFSSNVTGTLNLLEAARRQTSVKGVVVVTSDKCYRNLGKTHAFVENDPLGGKDPYSAGKACAALMTHCYRDLAAQRPQPLLIAEARAGNVIGGGDDSAFRLIPDMVRALQEGKPIGIRNPDHIRPWQHCLDPLYGYLLLGTALLAGNHKAADAWNFGPTPESCVSVQELVNRWLALWGSGTFEVVGRQQGQGAEAQVLQLNSQKAEQHLGRRPIWSLASALSHTADWYRNPKNRSIRERCEQDIADFEADLQQQVPT
ncbi:CDP-glucose 4,6-dehydratase [Acanthopleuribacter pedis]|uniref:CDP-glucose 4,6-dehydratase n=1 Tax=Acanthopleuribacter pedis TaxID=442870 RepID=A0A8J7QGC9_9BACT|nr:CDP-glucose 4,6-dehydratase [Acanthopleuribacter pedis]MBO1318040.1 CDP-glucose 4,6-dehydratase [Acanthopleuribacter pedis]